MPLRMMADKIMDQKYSIQNHQSESETKEMFDVFMMYSCFMCNKHMNSHFSLDAHLETHVDDDTFHHSNINRITEPLPQSAIKPPKYFGCKCQDICKSKLQYNEHMLNHSGEKLYQGQAEEEKSEKHGVQEGIESIQNTFRKGKQQLTNYNTEEYQKLLDTLILEKNSTGQFNEAKFIGPLFWKNALIKAELIEEDIRPMHFQGHLKPIECTSCKKCFARLPISNEGNILPSTPPCFRCFQMKNESKLSQHQDENHRVFPPYICKECLWVSDTWYKYVCHMKMHLRYAAKCSECICSDTITKPADRLFLCILCEMFFDSKDELKVHVQIHF